MASRDLYQEVTDRILSKLKDGVIPWKQPWENGKSSSSSLPRNALTKRGYSGVNLLLLWITTQERDYKSNEYLTYKQAVELKGNVKKGEKGTSIIYVNFLEDKVDPKKKIAFLKSYTVFNVEQCENLNLKEEAVPAVFNTREELIEDFIISTDAKIVYGGSIASYSRKSDVIHIPELSSFHSTNDFYTTTFHEIIHWSGHETRCNREKHKSFGDDTYSGEELIAELGSSFLCAEFSINNEDSNASYIHHWIKFLTDHPKAILAAASAASRAVEFLRGKVLEETEALPLAA